MMELRIVLINLFTRPDMYICNCNGITERQIEGAVDLGCASVADLRRDLGVGSCCGKCVPDARKLLRRCSAVQPPALCFGRPATTRP